MNNTIFPGSHNLFVVAVMQFITANWKVYSLSDSHKGAQSHQNILLFHFQQ